MSMIINFFAIPDILARETEKGKTSVVELAKYTQEAYDLDSEEDSDTNQENIKNAPSDFKEPLELYYYPTFSILEKFYEIAFHTDNEVPIAGRQPFSEEEAEILLSEYVTYAGGFLTFEDIKQLNNKFSKLSFEDFLEMVFGHNHLKKQEVCNFIKKELGFSEKEILEELPSIKEYYNEFASYTKKLVQLEEKEKLGLFISID
ncbi:MAG: hypothetical protein C0514_09065 [Candidatus Puniceispirillum sp.]|nr:hypothetical protein [Candidatus Puniceispirillum sp.]